MLYRVTIYRPNQYERCFEAAESWVVGTLRAAELTAKEKLPPSNETTHIAKFARLPYADVKEWGKNVSVRTVTTYETPINYVPSVGDLGYTP